MRLPEIKSPIVDLIMGIIFPVLGIYIISHRMKIIETLLHYEKFICEKLGFLNYNGFKLMNKIMIMAIGVAFAVTGISGIVNVVIYVFTEYR